MLGNDIVDLGDPETREHARHARFDHRAFCDAERAAIAQSSTPTRTRWMLWAAKEAAYKAARRDRSDTVFSPPRFRVTLEGDGAGQVRHGDQRFAAHVDTVGSCVHALAGSELTSPDMLYGCARLQEVEAADPGHAARDLAIRRIAQRLERPRSAVRIERVARIPQLLVDGEPSGCTLSLSHHGNFIGFACRIESSLGVAA